MATITAKSGNGLLGTLGGLATIAGSFAGAPAWLTPLGMGVNMLGGGGNRSNGRGANNPYMSQVLNDIVCGGWYNPASGNLAKKPGDDSGILEIVREYMNK